MLLQVSEENNNGRKGVELCAEKGLTVGNILRSSAGKERYTALCAGWEGSEGNGMRILRLTCCGDMN